MLIDAYSYSDIGGRKDNEDTVGFRRTENGIAAVVADGLGGQGDGKAASRIVCESLLRGGTEGELPDPGRVGQLFEAANCELIRAQQNSFHMKTTAVFLRIEGEKAIWAHVGDSRLYHIYNGKICAYTLDHSAAQLAVYMGQITREQIPQNSGQSRLLRAMGVRDERAEIHEPVMLQKGKHVFLLCSDGVWEYLSDAEIEKICSREPDARKITECIRQMKNSRSPAGCDNNSAVVICAEI